MKLLEAFLPKYRSNSNVRDKSWSVDRNRSGTMYKDFIFRNSRGLRCHVCRVARRYESSKIYFLRYFFLFLICNKWYSIAKCKPVYSVFNLRSAGERLSYRIAVNGCRKFDFGLILSFRYYVSIVCSLSLLPVERSIRALRVFYTPVIVWIIIAVRLLRVSKASEILDNGMTRDGTKIKL